MLQQQERVLSGWAVALASTASAQNLRVLLSSGSNSEDVFKFSFEALRANVLRTRFTSKSHPLQPYPSTRPMEAQLDGVI